MPVTCCCSNKPLCSSTPPPTPHQLPHRHRWPTFPVPRLLCFPSGAERSLTAQTEETTSRRPLASNRRRAAAWGPSSPPQRSALNKSISVWKLWRRPLNPAPLGWLWGRPIWDVSRRSVSNVASGEIALNYIWIQPQIPPPPSSTRSRFLPPDVLDVDTGEEKKKVSCYRPLRERRGIKRSLVN